MNKLVKLLGIMVCCCILGLCMPATVLAAEGYTYDAENGTLVIHTPEGITAYENDLADYQKATIKSITIGADVLVIPAQAFSVVRDLETLIFEGPIEIKSGTVEGDESEQEWYPFSTAEDLKDITFAGEVTLGDGLFNSICVETLTFPADATLGNNAFKACVSLRDVIFKGDAKIMYSGFQDCWGLQEVVFEGDAEIMGSGFMSCVDLEKLTFNGESHLGPSAFRYTTALKEIYFGKKTYIDAGAFSYGENARNEEDAGEAIAYGLRAYEMGSSDSNMDLKSLSFPAGSILKQGVFTYCRGLESITFEGDIVLDGGPFVCASGLKTIVFGGTCELKSGAFGESIAIENITFGGVAKIDNGIFTETNIKALDFPAGSTFKASNFSKAPLLESLIFRGDVELRDGGTFMNVPKLKTLVFEGESVIGSGVLSTTTELETVTFGKKVTFIGSGCFQNSKVKELIFPDGSSLNNSGLFENAPELVKVVFEGDVVLGMAVISTAEKLEEVIFKGTSEIAAGSIYEVPKLQKLVFEKAVKLTGAAFTYAGTTADKPIESIVLPAGSEVYNWVTMANVNYIEFQDLEVPDFSYYLFSNLPTSTVFYVPCTVLEDYRAAIKTVIETAIVQDESTRINFEDVKIEGKHSYTLQKDESNHWQECVCQDKIEVEAHSYGDWSVTKEPTTSEVGQKERSCGVCGYKETAEIEMLEPTPEPTVVPTPEPTPVPTATPESTVTPAPTTEPETLKEMVDDLSVLVDENATKEEKVEAVKDIVEKVKEMVADNNVSELTTSYIEEMEATIAEATGRKLSIVSKDEELPAISAVAGAFLGLNPEEDGTIVFETVAEEDIPAMDEKYENGYAFDIQLFEGDDKTQPIVPVTIRMILPKSIDQNAKIVVLHYANGSTTPEVLNPTVKDGVIEFTTSSFSTFVITNEVAMENGGNSGAGEAILAPTEAPTPQPTDAPTAAPTEAPTQTPATGSENPAPATGDSANPMAAIAVMLLTCVSAAVIIKRRKSEEEE